MSRADEHDAPEPHGLAVANLSVRLGGRRVLEGIDAAFDRGRVTALLGANGAGKSTLLACLAGLRRPDAGEVRLNGRELNRLSARERARRLGFLPQAPEIAWAVDVRTLVGLGRIPHRGGLGSSGDDDTAVERALEATGLSALAQRDVTTLSGGERARALIARVFAGAPEWILADEPLTGLDLAHQLDAARLLRGFAATGGSVVVTLHDLALASRIAHRVIVLAGGHVLAAGSPAEVLTPAVLARAFEVEARWVQAPSGPLLEVIGPSFDRARGSQLGYTGQNDHGRGRA